MYKALDNKAPDKRRYSHNKFLILFMETYVVGTHYKHLGKMLLMSTYMFSWRTKKNISGAMDKMNFVFKMILFS